MLREVTFSLLFRFSGLRALWDLFAPHKTWRVKIGQLRLSEAMAGFFVAQMNYYDRSMFSMARFLGHCNAALQALPQGPQPIKLPDVSGHIGFFRVPGKVNLPRKLGQRL